MPKHLVLRRGAEQRALRGHLWIFSGELAEGPAGLREGEVVRVLDRRGDPVGEGFYAGRSGVAVRLMTRGATPWDPGLLQRRIAGALARRAPLRARTEMMRVIHGEADGLPGLVVDRYGEHLVLQCFAAGMEALLPEVVPHLVEASGARSLVHARRSVHRKKEGLELGDPVVLHGTPPSGAQCLSEGDLRFEVDLAVGPKGGFFLDQRENRAALRSYVRPGDRVLDLFCGSGGFGFSAARAGAGSVLLADSSPETLRRAEASAVLNGLMVDLRRDDLIRNLPEWAERDPEAYDLVVLDPPNMARGRASLPTAYRAYVKVNAAALRLVRPGGTLLSCSCSQPLGRDLFLEMLGEAARRAGRLARILELRGAGMDHPILPGMPETEYLKAAFVAVD